MRFRGPPRKAREERALNARWPVQLEFVSARMRRGSDPRRMFTAPCGGRTGPRTPAKMVDIFLMMRAAAIHLLVLLRNISLYHGTYKGVAKVISPRCAASEVGPLVHVKIAIR